jgi:hypothetical protein
MAQARAVEREFSGESEEDSAMTKNDLFKEGMEFRYQLCIEDMILQ